jgi:pyridoxamine 5'-phosphate oxidase
MAPEHPPTPPLAEPGPARLTTLPEIETALWQELARAARDRHHEWRTPVLATIDPAPGASAGPGAAAKQAGAADADDPPEMIGAIEPREAIDAADLCWPDARTVVLREVMPQERLLVIYSDARAAKLRQLQASPRALLVMWSRRLGWQLRLRVHIEAHSDGLAATSRWMRMRATPAAQDYLSPLTPGTPLSDGGAGPADLGAGARPSAAPGGAAGQRTHFSVLLATVHSIDWLHLHPDGHCRARFDADGSRWLVP